MGRDWNMSLILNSWDVFWMNEVQMMLSVVGRWRVGGELHVLLGSWLMLKVCSLSAQGGLHETLLVIVLMYCSETVIWKDEERYRIRDVQTNNILGLVGIRRMDKLPNSRIKDLYGVTKGLGTKRLVKAFSGGSAMWKDWEGNDRIAKRVYVGGVCRQSLSRSAA